MEIRDAFFILNTLYIQLMIDLIIVEKLFSLYKIDRVFCHNKFKHASINYFLMGSPV